jgi:putative phosphoesterase
MKIAILSDTHNETQNLRKAVNAIQAAKISVVFHCGDLTSPSMASELNGLEVNFTFGNGDFAARGIENAILATHLNSSCGYRFTGDISGIPIAATHGHMSDILDDLATSGKFRYVFVGHTHRRKDELIGSTRVINPGSLGGTFREEHSFAILDLDDGDLEFIQVP